METEVGEPEDLLDNIREIYPYLCAHAEEIIETYEQNMRNDNWFKDTEIEDKVNEMYRRLNFSDNRKF